LSSTANYSEDELLPLSALQHLLFCKRRAALVFIENVWEDNPYTVEGTQLHQKIDDMAVESRGKLKIARGLWLRSLKLGLIGKADVVEFHCADPPDNTQSSGGVERDAAIRLPGTRGLWSPFPVEYKRGRLRREEGYEVQLCAQALCLEEMLNVRIPAGAIFYGKPRRRLEVEFSPELRVATETAASELHKLFDRGITPKASYEKKCESCSLLDICLPKAMKSASAVDRYIQKALGK